MFRYEESQADKKTLIDTNRDQFIKYGPFTPKYPVYNNPQEKTSHL